MVKATMYQCFNFLIRRWKTFELNNYDEKKKEDKMLQLGMTHAWENIFTC